MQPRELLWHSKHLSRQLLRSGQPSVGRQALLQGSPGEDWDKAFQSFRSGTSRPVLLDRHRAARIAADHPQYLPSLIQSAEAAANLSFQFFGYPMVELPRPVDWNYDPIAGHKWPTRASDRFGRAPAGGDVKWIWELNRLQHLPLLAEAWLFTGDARYSVAAFDQLDSWIEQNPPGRGIAWRGAFECGIRAISIAIALQGLRDAAELTPERFRRVVKLLAASADRCWEERSLFSSANNHLVGEMAGLAVVSMLVPELRNAAGWERNAIRTLSIEAPKQILADGAGAEQAVGYQMFTVELLNLVAVLMAQRDGSPPAPIRAAIARSSSYLATLVDGGDPPPRYGDDDGGFALRLGAQRKRTIHDHLGIVSVFGGAVPGVPAHNTLDAEWLRRAAAEVPGYDAKADPAIDALAETGSFVADHGGLAVLRAQATTMTVDVGPLGYLSIAAHGHADALNVTLSVAGDEIISDPGTGSYHGHPEWRAVLRGTRAHATVCVDGENQSVAGGPFFWRRHASVKVRGIDLESGIVDAQHDGYERLPGRVFHRRWVLAPPKGRTQLIIDLITGKGQHSCLQNWTLHPSLDVLPCQSGHVLSRENQTVGQLLYAASADVEIGQVRGDRDSNLGWWSDELESRTPAWWLSASCKTDLPLVMVALFSPSDGIATENLSVKPREDLIEVDWTEGGQTRSVKVYPDYGARVTWN